MLAIESHQLAAVQPMAAVGCKNCHGKGYRGRLGIFEIFVLNDELRNLINQATPSFKLHQYARTTGMLSGDWKLLESAGAIASPGSILETLGWLEYCPLF